MPSCKRCFDKAVSKYDALCDECGDKWMRLVQKKIKLDKYKSGDYFNTELMTADIDKLFAQFIKGEV